MSNLCGPYETHYNKVREQLNDERVERLTRELQQLKQPTKRTSMEIVDKRDSITKQYQQIALGHTFEIKGEFYVKCNTDYAVNVKNMEYYLFNHTDIVTPVKATLTIERLV